MNLRYLAILGLVIATNCPASKLDDYGGIIGPGAITCGHWIQARKTDDTPDPLAWVLGFISSYNHYRDRNIFGSADHSAIAAWIDNYCTKNPLDTVYIGTVALVSELEKRSNRK